MPRGLPEGLVNTRDVVSGEIERVDRVDAEDVQKLWKVYHSKKAALADNVGERLENFFWRIWSSQRIRQRLTGTQVALQFSKINEGGYIRTTPTPSPRSSRSLSSYYRATRSRTPPTSSHLQAPTSPTESESSPSTAEDEASSVTPTPTSPLSAGTKSSTRSKENRRSASSTRPPPILKKSSSGSTSGSSSMSSKLVTVSPTSLRDTKSSPIGENEEAVVFDDNATPTGLAVAPPGRPATTRRSVTTRFNEEVAVSIPKPSTSVVRSAKEKTGRSPSGESSLKPGRKSLVVVANTGASKTRPFIGRRKSSQTSSLHSSRTPSYSNLARSPKASSSKSKNTSSKEQETARKKGARAVSPHPSEGKKPLSSDPTLSEGSSDGSGEERITGRQDPTRKGKARIESTDHDGDDDDEDSEDSGKQEPEAPKPLVDPNFRSKFVGKTRSAQGSYTNLPSLLRKSAAAGPASASYQAAGTMNFAHGTTGRGVGREAFTNIVTSLKAPAAAGTQAISDEDLQPLPRTKSQLTLLLERERNRTAREEQPGRKSEGP